MNAIFRKNAVFGLVLAGALSLGPAVFAQDAPEGGAAVKMPFFPMFQVAKGSGGFFVARPGLAPEPGVAGRAYPYVSRLTVNNAAGDKGRIFLAPDRQIALLNGADVVIGPDPKSASARQAKLLSGSIETHLGTEEEETLSFSVVTEAAVFRDFRGRMVISAQDAGDSWKAGVRVASGKVTVEAPQLCPSRLGNTSGLVIATQKDKSFTTIDGVLGDYTLFVENGTEPPYEAAFHVGSRIKIWRSWAPKSHLLAVSVLIANVDGAVADSYAFNEGQAPVKSGVVSQPEEGASADAPAAAPDVVPDELSDFDSGFGDSADSLSGDSLFGSGDDSFNF